MCPPSPAGAVARTRPSSTARPGSSSTTSSGATDALARLLDDAALRAALGTAARARAVAAFTYDALARRLGAALDAAAAGPRP